MTEDSSIDLADYPLRELDHLWPADPRRLVAHASPFGWEAFASHRDCRQRLDMTVCDSRERLHLTVWLHGGVDVSADGHHIKVGGGDSVSGFMPGTPWQMSLTGRTHSVGLVLPPHLLETLAGEAGDTFFQNLCCAGSLRTRPADAVTLRAAHELNDVLMQAHPNRLLCEAKSLELLACFVEPHRDESIPGISRGDRERLVQARELLLSNLAHPPTMTELGRACGLNTLKLKRGFKLLFGHPVYVLYQRERMSEAWRMIESGLMSVTEAGRALGYTNMSHFGAAFRRMFGLLPSELRRRSRPAGR